MTKDEEEMWVRAMRTYLKQMTGTRGWTVRPLSKLLKAAVHELDLALPLSTEVASARIEGVLASMSQLFDCALQSDGRPVDEGRRIRGIVAAGARGGMPAVVTVDLRPAQAGGTAVWLRAAARELTASQRTAEKAARAVAERLAQRESTGAASAAGAWFEVDPSDEAEMSSAEAAFAAALRGHSSAWAPADVDGYVSGFGADGVTEPLVACADLTDHADPPHFLFRAGVHLLGDWVRGDRLHSQLFSLPGCPSSWALDAHGTPERLAESSARWFRMVLGKPVVLYVWLHDDYAYAARYAFADTGETLTQCYNQSLAPAGQAEELIAAGHVHGRGWIQTTGLPAPSCYFHIRGDLGKGTVPPGVPAPAKRGPIPGLWYEGQ
ncbi:MAG TPA: hypothetical protein VF223_02320 [Trebonia sp.]